MMYADEKCTYTENQKGYIFKGPCVKCKKKMEVFVPSHELFSYRQGNFIQNAMKSVSTDDREFLQSGICPECWDKLWE